jgi:hypothetical protein
MQLWVSECKCALLFEGLADAYSLLFGVVYWYVWTVLLPLWGGYRLEEEVNVLDDGTSITKLVPSYIL